MVGGELRQKLVVGDARRSVETSLLLDLGADRQGDVPRQRNILQVLGYVEVGLVQRQGLNDWGMFGEDVAFLLRDRLVDLEARLDEDQVWTLPFGRH
jgi:hypothetical protein